MALNPPADCPLCPRLAAYRAQLRREQPGWHNAPVPAFGDFEARLLVVGLAPGKSGANRTGRVFTGDYAGDVLYAVLADLGLADGTYAQSPADGLRLRDCAIANALACAPPANKPTAAEIAACRPWLARRIQAMQRLRAIVALGRIAHESVLRVFGASLREMAFGHGARHVLEGGVCLFDSYHCSRYNINTRRLNADMLRQVFAAAKTHMEAGRRPAA